MAQLFDTRGGGYRKYYAPCAKSRNCTIQIQTYNPNTIVQSTQSKYNQIMQLYNPNTIALSKYNQHNPNTIDSILHPLCQIPQLYNPNTIDKIQTQPTWNISNPAILLQPGSIVISNFLDCDRLWKSKQWDIRSMQCRHRTHFYRVNMAPGVQVKIAVHKMWKCWAQSSYVYPNWAGIEWIAQDCVKLLQSRIALNCSRIVWIGWGLWPIRGLAIGISIQQIQLQWTKSWQNPISWLM